MKELMEKIIKNKIIIIYVIMSIIIAHTLIKLPSIFEVGESSDWIGFYGDLIGSFLGVLGAYVILKYQLRQEKEEERKNKEPKIVIGEEKYENKKLQIGRDLGDEDLELNFKNKLSIITIPIINGGITPVFNLKFHFEIIDYNNAFSCYAKFSDENKMEFRCFEENSRLKIMISENEESSFQGKVYSKYGRADDISVIMPGEKIDLNMPIAYIELIKFYFSNIFTDSSIKYETKQKVEPVLKVKVTCEDYELKEKINNYYITLGSYSSLSNKLDGNYVTFSLRRLDESNMENHFKEETSI